MKICKNCKNKIEDDALVCPYCGCVSKKPGSSKKSSDESSDAEYTNIESDANPKKRRTWLWVIGWIFIFPLPLTILLLRNKKLNKIVKIVIIVIAWIFYIAVFSSASGESDIDDSSGDASISGQEESNITELSFTDDDDVTIEVGESVSPGYLKASVNSKNKFSSDDVIFVSEDEKIAEISFTEDSSTTKLYFEITGVGGGETDVYATSADGSIVSNKIHVIVSAPIEVETIVLEGYETDLVIGETTEANISISPSDADDQSITWASSDDSVATVDEDGVVTAVGGGSATISASSSNGVQASFEVTVDGSKTLMNLNVKRSREDDVNIGDEWSYDIEVNGERPSDTMGLAVGDVISFEATFTEADTNPDVGTASTSHTVTEDDLVNGFEVSMDLYVTENGGRYSGQSAHFVITFTFSPIE